MLIMAIGSRRLPELFAEIFRVFQSAFRSEHSASPYRDYAPRVAIAAVEFVQSRPREPFDQGLFSVGKKRRAPH
jgi:hypothetical protein